MERRGAFAMEASNGMAQIQIVLKVRKLFHVPMVD